MFKMALMYVCNPLLLTGAFNPYLAVATEAGTADVQGLINEVASEKGGTGFESLNKTAKEVGGGSYNLLLTIGAAIAIVFMIILGIKFIVGGTGQAKQEVKERSFQTVIGILLIFGAVAIVGMIAIFATGLFTTTTTAGS